MTGNNGYKVLIRESHVDSYGHLNNATYLMLYEEARWELITPRGFGFEQIHNTKVGPVILEVNLKFLKEVLLREEVTIHTEVLEYKGKIGRMLQQMVKSDGTVANQGHFTFALFDMQKRKLIEPTEQWKKALGLD